MAPTDPLVYFAVGHVRLGLFQREGEFYLISARDDSAALEVVATFACEAVARANAWSDVLVLCARLADGLARDEDA